MGDFVRTHSKVWWGNFQTDKNKKDDNLNIVDVNNREGVEVEEDEDGDWMLEGAACCNSGNNSCSESDRGSSGSPESHKSQDSGFSDSDSNSPNSIQSINTRLIRENCNDNKKSEEEKTFDIPDNMGNKDNNKKLKENRTNKSKSNFNSTTNSYPLKDIKNTLERNINLCTQNKRTSIQNDNNLELPNTQELTDDENFNYQDKKYYENKKKFNSVVKELKTTLNFPDKFEPDLNIKSTLGESCSNNTLKINNKNEDDIQFKKPFDKPKKIKHEHRLSINLDNLKSNNLNESRNSNEKIISVCGTIPKCRLNINNHKDNKNITNYDYNKSLERTRLRRSEISESSVNKLFFQSNPNKSLEESRSFENNILDVHKENEDENSTDSTYVQTEETARFVGDISPSLSSSGSDNNDKNQEKNSSTWSIPGPPAHCSTPKSSKSDEGNERILSGEKYRRITPQKLNFNDKEFVSDNHSEINLNYNEGQYCRYDNEHHSIVQPLNHWVKEIRYLYEPECMTTLQSKSLTADLNSQVTIMAAVTTEAVRTLQYRTKLISTEFTKLYRQVESGVLDHVGPLVQSLIGHVTEFLNTCNTSVNDKKILGKACERLRSSATCSKPDQHVLINETTNLGRTFTNCVDGLLLEQVKVLMAVLDEPSSPILLLTALSSLTGLGLEGLHLSQLVARCCGGIRAILTICLDSRNVSVRTAALRTLTTVCCSSHTIRQLEQAGGVEILSEILQDYTRSEMEISEAISVIVQITAPWIEDNHTVLGLSEQLTPLVSSVTRIVSNTTSSSTLLLCAAALCHLSQMEPQCIWTMLDNSTIGTLLLAIRRQGPFAPVFLREQAAGLIANMAAVPEARTHLSEHRAVVALLCFLQARHSPLQSSAEVAASERLQHKSAIALSRICSDPAVAAQVVELQGVTRLVRLCREEHERNHSDGVLVACLAALRKIVANCGTKSVEQLNALELVEPRLLDSFLIYSSRQESYV